jgi:acetyl esterase/lipase
MTLRPQPRYDPELRDAIARIGAEKFRPVTPQSLEASRQVAFTRPVEEVLAGTDLTHRELVITAPDSEPVTLSVFSRMDHTAPGPGVYWTHGGGMTKGDRFLGIERPLDWVRGFDIVCVSVEYRLAPEFPDPQGFEDAATGLEWTCEHAAELGIDPARLLVAGSSAGGLLAAAMALRARDRGGPALIGQLLIEPMLDDTGETASWRQPFKHLPITDSVSMNTNWNALLGDRRATESVGIYSSPSRARDLSGLPPAFLDVGSSEVFRDEIIAYASAIWASGGDAELHVWPGGFHGFDLFVPDATLSRAARRARAQWLARVLDRARRS